MNAPVPGMMKHAMEQYHLPRIPGEVDLVSEVRTLLINQGLQQKVVEAYDNHRYIIEARDKAANIQRHLLNRYWDLQLKMTTKHAVNERYFLVPNGNVEDWLGLFKNHVLPFVVANNLPVLVD